jgi:hypothetical protein
MQLVTAEKLDAYLADDEIDHLLSVLSEAGDEALTCQRWLRDTPAKRMICRELYGDLLAGPYRRRVLDVGGGATALTRRLAEAHDYVLVDVLAHGGLEIAQSLERGLGRNIIAAEDWFDYRPGVPFDVVIANDLFPNVDQRLELFLDRFLPVASTIRLSLTYYNEPRFYRTIRQDSEEQLCMLAWNGAMTRRVIERFRDRIVDADLALFEASSGSVFANGRQVCLVELKGDVPAGEMTGGV